ncbi:hypothetical protein D3C72_1146490 [compost metagenome]
MSGEKSFYKSLGRELMRELHGLYAGAELITGGSFGAYETLTFPNGMSVRFTSWRGGGGPFYIILFKGPKYVFELDLSMVVHGSGRFTWHLKVPSHDANVTLLDAWLGKPLPFTDDYSRSVKQVKARLFSGSNTPRTGYRFIDDSEWFAVCDRFLDLMRRAIRAHDTQGNYVQPLVEAEDDDGSVVNAKRKVRRNQSRFRLNMMELYGSKCSISGEGVVEVLEAAHIVGHADTGINHTANGLLLRSDLHRLFDASLIAINPRSLAIAVSLDLAETEYQKLAGQKLRSRVDGTHPAQKYLETKWDQAGLKNEINRTNDKTVT